MIAVETNLLIYAHRKDSPFHQKASACIRRLAEGHTPWAIPWPCLYEFFGIVTHPRIYRPPTPQELALEQIQAWLESPQLVLLQETSAFWESLRLMLMQGQVAGPLVHDAKIAALCIEHGVSELWTLDRDFSRFPKLKVCNPLL